MKLIFSLLLLTIVVAVSGCGLDQREPAQTDYFLLTVERPDTEPAVVDGPCLQIRLARVAPSFAGRSLIYRTGQVLFDQDYYHRFLSTPDTQISAILKSWFQQAGFGYCDPQNSRRYVMETQVTRLYADFSDPGNPAAMVQMQVSVSPRNPSGDRRLLLDETFTAATPLPQDPSAAQVVQGMSASLTQILQEVEAALIASVDKASGT